MWQILILATLVTFTVADVSLNAPGGYSSSVSGNNLPPRIPNERETVISADNYVPKVFKHVYLFSGEDNKVQNEKRVIRVPGGDKHVNIIFVKAPSTSESRKTEVVLPQEEHQNIVYVLLKKEETNDNVHVVRPESTQPQKPEVHFIQYQDTATTADSSSVRQPPQPPRVPSGLYETRGNRESPYIA